MRVEPKPNPIPFGIYKTSKPTHYGKYMVGEYKGKRIEVYDAKEKYGQKLYYVCSNTTLKWIKSKLISFKNGIVDKILYSSNKNR